MGCSFILAAAVRPHGGTLLTLHDQPMSRAAPKYDSGPLPVNGRLIMEPTSTSFCSGNSIGFYFQFEDVIPDVPNANIVSILDAIVLGFGGVKTDAHHGF